MKNPIITSALAGLAVFSLVFFAPLSASATQFQAGEQVSVQGEKTIAGNFYVAGGEVVVTSPVTGDLTAVGGKVQIRSTVAGDVLVMGGDVQIDGEVSGDVRVAGGDVMISGLVTGEVLAAGGNVEIGPEAVVGEATVTAGKLVVAGTTGSVWAGVGELAVQNSAHIKGNLVYTSEKEAVVAAGAAIDGEVEHTVPPVSERDAKKGAAAFFGGGLMWILSGLLMLLLFVYVLPNKSLALSREWKANFGMNLLWGVIFLIVAPIAGMMLLVSIVGLPLAAGIFLFYPVILYLGKLTAMLAVGVWLRSIWMKQDGEKADFLAACFGLVLMTLVGLIPGIGWLAVFIAWVGGVGTLMSHDWALYKRLRLRKEF
ncbi:MAG: polymer-forming cytoskeletal protein [Candidatus Andersenbacteria bacterium]|nr:polymer-forming cytoskeletal protein [Candidatus Andersenbacteria bacterium]